MRKLLLVPVFLIALFILGACAGDGPPPPPPPLGVYTTTEDENGIKWAKIKSPLSFNCYEVAIEGTYGDGESTLGLVEIPCEMNLYEPLTIEWRVVRSPLTEHCYEVAIRTARLDTARTMGIGSMVSCDLLEES